MVTPMVSGTAALLLQKDPGWSPLEIKMALRNTAKYLSYDINTQGYGRIDALGAVVLPDVPSIAVLNTSGTVNDIISISGTATGRDFANYSIEYGTGNGAWLQIGNSTQQVNNSILMTGWDTTQSNEGEYFLRLIVRSNKSISSEDMSLIKLNNIVLRHPQNNDIFRLGDTIEINATIWGATNNYTIEYGKGIEPQVWLNEGINLTFPGDGNRTINEIIATWNTSSIKEPDFYSLRISVYRNTSISRGYVRNIYLDPTLKKGWPINIEWDHSRCSPNSDELCYYWGGFLEPAVKDIDGDGVKEIIVYSGGVPPKVYVFKPDGSPKSGFPVDVGSKGVAGGNLNIPLVVDMDNDGKFEMIAYNYNSNYTEKSELFIIRYDGSLFHGGPILLPVDYHPTLLAADLDNDGNKEIVIKGNSALNRYLTIVNASGAILSQWKLNNVSWGASIDSSPAIGNFDNDPEMEIVAAGPAEGAGGVYENGSFTGWNNTGVVNVFKLDGTPLTGWPVYTDGIPFSSPAVGDIDQDGSPDIIIGSLYASSAFDIRYGGVYAFKKNGSIMPGFPFLKGESFWSSPSLADFNRDGYLEIATSRLGFDSYILDHKANVLPGWPRQTVWNDYYSTIAGDMNGDGIPEIITTAGNGIPPYSGGVYAWNVNGTLLDGFPKVTESDAQAPAALDDIDNDGRVDLLASSDFDNDAQTGRSKMRGTIYAWDTNGIYNADKMPWPTFHHDNGRTGLYDISDIIPVNRSAISFEIRNLVIPKQFERSLNLSIDSVPDGLSGYNISISVSNASVINLTSVEFPEWTALFYNSSLPGNSVWLKAVDLNNKVQSGAGNVILGKMKIKGGNPGNASITINVNSMDDDNGEAIDPITVSTRINIVSVVPLPGMYLQPSDPDRNGLFEDINGNGRIDFNDVVLFFKYFEWIPDNEPVEYFDFNRNSRIDFNDIIKLFEEL